VVEAANPDNRKEMSRYFRKIDKEVLHNALDGFVNLRDWGVSLFDKRYKVTSVSKIEGMLPKVVCYFITISKNNYITVHEIRIPKIIFASKDPGVEKALAPYWEKGGISLDTNELMTVLAPFKNDIDK
jgi:hypothetical protein